MAVPSLLDPVETTVGDLVRQALRECGAIGVGQTPLAEDQNDAQVRLQWMLQQWERKRWLVYHLVTLAKVSTGQQSYTVGPGGDIDPGNPASDPYSPAFNSQFGGGVAPSVRPARIESAFLRQLVNSQPNQVDYRLAPLQSREDYNRIALKGLVSFPGWFFYDSAWPLGVIFPWPVPQASIYGLFISIMEQLPISFTTQAVKFNIPYEYYNAMLFNLALRLRPKYGITSGPGDHLPGLAKDSLNVLRGANAQIARLQMPADMQRAGIYNIFSDQVY